MYSLFKLVRLLSIKDEVKCPKISCYAWREHGESSLLALACTNGFIVLRYSTSGKAPVVKQIPWPPDHPIIDLSFDPTVAWLLVLTDNANLFIIPALAMLDRECQVNRLWRLDDVTILTSIKPRGTPTKVIWWHTLDGQQIAIMATKLGELLFVNLVSEKVIVESDVDGSVRKLELLTDDQQMTTHLLITGTSGIQWKLLLETRVAPLAAPDTDLNDLGFENIDGLHLPVTSILTQTVENSNDMFMPLRFYQFPRSVHLSPQYAKGRHFVAAHCDKNSTYQIYDSNIEHNPLFLYKLPLGSMKVIFTDRLTFAASRLSGEQKLMILSNQRAETSESNTKDFNMEAVVQQFDLAQDEHLLNIHKKSFPFYWHEKIEATQISKLTLEDEDQDQDQTGPDRSKSLSALGVQLTSHTVLDGCIIVTDTTVYECRPRISPERLFLELCINQSDTSFPEQLGISLSLDLNFLFEIAADFLLAHGNSKQAARLFQIAKGSPVKRVASFAKYGFIQDVMPYLQQLLGKENPELGPDERKQLSDMALDGLVYQVKHVAHSKPALVDTFRQFLFNNFDFDVHHALGLLASAGLEDVLFEFAMARGLVIDALEALAQEGRYQISTGSLDLLVGKGFSAHVARAASGAFLQCLSGSDVIKVFCDKPQLVAQHSELLLGNLNDLDLGSLLQLAEVLDPSRPLVRGFIQRKLMSRRRASSITSISGGEMADSGSGSGDRSESDATTMVHCFLMVVLTLNHKRREDMESVDTKYLFTSPTEYLQTMADSVSPVKLKLAFRPVLVSGGQNHSALVLNGDLYTWGKTTNGRLGQGESRASQSVEAPSRVEAFNMLQIRVISVACGGEHTMALTQQGVYGWGSSKYGQVGLDTRHVYTRPMLVEGLARVTCAAIDCGQFHTLALTDDAEVYSWGWGIHGQLGHGDPEDQLAPQLVSRLSNRGISRVSGGFCHSLALSHQGEMYAFGCGFFGQLGLGTTQKHTSPVKITKLPEKIVTMGTKFFHSAAVTASNKVYQWGGHPHGLRYFVHTQRRARQNGQQMFEQVDGHLVPQLVDTTYVHGRIRHVICGSFHTCLVTKDGDVYTWGRNLDGQIGNGTRQDVRIPQMVTHINDRQISHMASGGEFNIAMDTDSHVWVWGRNDFGQLGLHHGDGKSTSKSGKLGPSKQLGSQNSITEVITPALLNVLPQSPLTNRLVSLAESFTRSVSLESIDHSSSLMEESYEEEDHSSKLPSLDTVGDRQYGNLVLPIVLQCLSSLCSCQQLVRKCVDLGDWWSAVSINLHQRNYSQALMYHLRALGTQRAAMEDTEFCSLSNDIFHHYYRLVCERKMSLSHQEEDLRLILTEIVQHWERQQLPTGQLEDCLAATLDNTAGQLALLLFRSTDGEIVEQEKGIGRDVISPSFMNISTDFRKSFTTKFCLQVMSRVLQKIEEVDASDNLFFSALKQLGGDVFENFPGVMQDGDKLPYDQLWQDIVQNLSKGINSKRYIYITRSEIDRLEEQSNLDETDQLSPSGGQGYKTPAVFFTCGHYYTKKSFTTEMKRFNRELSSGKAKLPETSSLLTEYYNRKGAVPMACPKCVSNVLPTLA